MKKNILLLFGAEMRSGFKTDFYRNLRGWDKGRLFGIWCWFFFRLFEGQYWVTEVLRMASFLSPSWSGVERENEDGWCILCIFKIHIYFQDTHFQDVISTKKYIFRKGNIQLCSKLFQRVQRVHRVHTGFCQKNIKTKA